jgi:hypothetical protein
MNRREDQMLAVTETGAQVLTLNQKLQKIDSLPCNLGNFKRSFTSLVITNDD